MTGCVIFLTHADVVIDPDVPVPDWGLSDQGRARHQRFAASADCARVATLFCSTERKARDGAEIVARVHNLVPRHRAALGENDRSATGYLPKDEFEQVADAFFANPDASVRGWERARDAQDRIVTAVSSALSEDRPAGDALIIAHGGVGALLRCHLLGQEISRQEDQPGNGGCWFTFDPIFETPPSEWRVI